MKRPITNVLLLISLVVIAWKVAWTNGERAGRDEQKQLSEVILHTHVYEIQLMTLEHMALLDAKGAYAIQEAKVESALNEVKGVDRTNVPALVSSELIDRIVAEHPERMKKISELRQARYKTEAAENP